MDGYKRRLNASIQLKLSLALSLAIVFIAILAGIFSFASAFDEAQELQDDSLRQVAALFDRQHLPAAQSSNDEDTRVIVQYLSDDKQGSRPKSAGGASLRIPNSVFDGLHTLKLGDDSYRVMVKSLTQTQRIVVAQETSVRDEIARGSALRTLLPFLILLPVLLLLVAQLVRKMFRPIALLSKEVDQRSEQELHALEVTNLPTELRPFVVAMNRLLARVVQAMDAQQRFVADAAHELRSPLTAMSLQVERLADADMSSQARERLETLQKGIERGRKLLDQLLRLAQAQSVSESLQSQISVQAIYRRVLEDLLPLAEAKHIDIGVEGGEDAQVWVREWDLMTLVKNLIDNAIRYTPAGGRIDLSVSTVAGAALLQVQDSGPGIAKTERERVFDPFYRILGRDQIGSGLGLSIVQTIAQRMGAQVSLSYSDEKAQSGLCVVVRVPTLASDAGIKRAA